MKGSPKGKSFNDRELAGKVRSLALERIYYILTKGEKHSLFAPVLERLTSNILPRLNVLSGDENAPLIVEISGTAANKYAINKGTGRDSK